VKDFDSFIKLKNKIIAFRQDINESISDKPAMNPGEVLDLSNKLDELISEYNKINFASI